MPHPAVRVILVSREFTAVAELEAMRNRMPSHDDFRWYVVWDYDREDVDDKYARFQQACLSLQHVVSEGEGDQPRG
jgi:hypothetical protein